MIRSRPKTFGLVALFAVSAAAMMGDVHVDAEPAKQPDEQGPKQAMSNQELMKFLFEPFTVDLKRSVQIEPENRQEWQSLYVAASRLSEAMNLLYFREGKEYMKTADWRKKVAESHQAALDVGAAVKKRDFPTAQVRYERLIQSCNDCHRKFEPGDPTIVPAW